MSCRKTSPGRRNKTGRALLCLGKGECSLELGDVKQNADVEPGHETPAPLPIFFISSSSTNTSITMAGSSRIWQKNSCSSSTKGLFPTLEPLGTISSLGQALGKAWAAFVTGMEPSPSTAVGPAGRGCQAPSSADPLALAAD